MRRIIAFIFAFVLTANCVMNVSAVENEVTDRNVIYHNDGSYSVIMIQVMETRESGSKLGTKTYWHYLPNNELQWTAVLRGLFHYDGVTSTCASSVCDVTIYNNDWVTASKNVRTSGNSALAYLKMNRVYSGLVTDTIAANLSLSCDPNGNLS